MCTLAIYVGAFVEFPVVVAANRDEFLARPTSPPAVLDTGHEIFGGRDDVAGGTWLAVNRAGVVAALLNRRTGDPPDPSRRSRGQLCLSMLRAASASAAAELLREEHAEAYNPFNLLVADRDGGWIATNHRSAMSFRLLEPGLHLVTNLDLNDPTCPRIAASYRRFAAMLASDAPRPASAEFRDRLQAVLASHDTQLDPRSLETAFGNSLCLHSAEYGTRSSTLLFLDEAGQWSYFHMNEPPCRGRYRSEPVKESLRGE
jgi:uncharacterized protein with NRDE domain